jgi:hypothetical protein
MVAPDPDVRRKCCALRRQKQQVVPFSIRVHDPLLEPLLDTSPEFPLPYRPVPGATGAVLNIGLACTIPDLAYTEPRVPGCLCTVIHELACGGSRFTGDGSR